MNKDATPTTNEVICPVCGRPMTLPHTIRRAFGENLNVFKCRPCGFSTTELVSWTTPVQIKGPGLKASLDLPSGDIFEGQKAGCRRHRHSMDATLEGVVAMSKKGTGEWTRHRGEGVREADFHRSSKATQSQFHDLQAMRSGGMPSRL
jgi:hypothetical protein